MTRLPIDRFTEFGSDLAPDFTLSIEGQSAGEGSQLFGAVRPLVESVSIEFDEEMSTIFELVIINQPEDAVSGAGGFGSQVNWQAVLNSRAFQEGNSIDLFMGFGGVHRFMGRVEILKWLPDFGADGPTSFTIKGFDGRHEMATGNQFKVGKKIGAGTNIGVARKTRKRKIAYKESDDQIVKRIAEKYGYGADVDPVERRSKAARVHETSVTDWAFLQKLAAINRFDLSVAFDDVRKQYVVKFKKRKDIGTAEFKFTYNGADGSLISAQPDFQIKDQPTDIELLVYDKKQRKIERTLISDAVPAEDVKLGRVGVGNFEVQKTLTVGARVRFAAFGQIFDAISAKPFKSKKEAQRFAEQFLRERERELMILQGVVIGIETLRPGQVHEIAGLSRRIDGLYRFTNVKHTMRPGNPYTCEFSAHRVLTSDVARRVATTATQDTANGAQAAG